MDDETLIALTARPRRDRGWLPSAAGVLHTVALLGVPVAAALLAAFVHRGYEELVWPPSPVLALAPLGSFLLMTRVTGSRVEVAVTVILSAVVALFATWGIALVLGMLEALDCLGANGGCLPW